MSFRSIAVVATIGFSIIAIFGYLILSLAINSLPPESHSLGWSALIQESSESQADQITLRLHTSNDDSATYEISACGPHPYTGKLILSGIFSHFSAEYVFADGGATVDMDAAHSEYIKNLTVMSSGQATSPYQGSGTSNSATGVGVAEVAELGSVRYVNIDLVKISPCSALLANGRIEMQISGHLDSPEFHISSELLGILHGPHASLSGPTIGTPPDGSFDLPPFEVTGEPGNWVPPAHINVRISMDTPIDWSMDTATPEPSDTDRPAWSSRGAIEPAAQFTNSPLMVSLENWLVLFEIGLGVGGGLVASLIFDFLRPQQSDHAAKASSENLSDPENTRGSKESRDGSIWSKPRFMVTTFALVIFYVLTRRRSPNRPS
jgi:hypothetical protein